MNNAMTIVVKKVNKRPVIARIPANTDGCLAALQKIVGGYIETVPFEDVLLICNEEGKLQGIRQPLPLKLTLFTKKWELVTIQ